MNILMVALIRAITSYQYTRTSTLKFSNIEYVQSIIQIQKLFLCLTHNKVQSNQKSYLNNKEIKQNLESKEIYQKIARTQLIVLNKQKILTNF